MTLAAILIVLFALSPQQSATEPAGTTQNQNNAPSQNSTTQSQPAQSKPDQSNTSPQKPSVSPHTTHHPRKKKVQPVDCNPAQPSGAPTPEGTSSTDSSQSDKTATNPPADGKAAADTHPAPTNCPPPKIVVIQGGTSEPSIQLSGDARSSPLRDTNQCPNASQCLQSAEQNLKKIAGRQLSASQRDMVTQVNQFMDQSKHATSTGDVESARTLAWKAQQISQELVGPEK